MTWFSSSSESKMVLVFQPSHMCSKGEDGERGGEGCDLSFLRHPGTHTPTSYISLDITKPHGQGSWGEHAFWKVKVKSLSCVRLFATPWTVAYNIPPSMGFSRQEYWSGLPFPFSEDLPNPGIEPGSPALQADALPSEPLGKSNMPFGL